MSVTIKDVAREANVSPSTVSKVMNHSPSIPDTTVQHVQEVMRRLRYYPNLQARNFVKKTTMNVVFLTKLTPHIAFENPHMFDILCGVQEVLTKKDYNLSLVGIHGLEESTETVKRIVAQKSGRHRHPRLRHYQRTGKPAAGSAVSAYPDRQAEF